MEVVGRSGVAAVLAGEVPNGGNAEVVHGGHGEAAEASEFLKPSDDV